MALYTVVKIPSIAPNLSVSGPNRAFSTRDGGIPLCTKIRISSYSTSRPRFGAYRFVTLSMTTMRFTPARSASPRVKEPAPTIRVSSRTRLPSSPTRGRTCSTFGSIHQQLLEVLGARDPLPWVSPAALAPDRLLYFLHLERLERRKRQVLAQPIVRLRYRRRVDRLRRVGPRRVASVELCEGRQVETGASRRRGRRRLRLEVQLG